MAVGVGLSVGVGVGVGVGLRTGVGVGDVVGVVEDEVFQEADITKTPLLQTNFLPLLMHVYCFPL